MLTFVNLYRKIFPTATLCLRPRTHVCFCKSFQHSNIVLFFHLQYIANWIYQLFKNISHRNTMSQPPHICVLLQIIPTFEYCLCFFIYIAYWIYWIMNKYWIYQLFKNISHRNTMSAPPLVRVCPCQQQKSVRLSNLAMALNIISINSIYHWIRMT